MFVYKKKKNPHTQHTTPPQPTTSTTTTTHEHTQKHHRKGESPAIFFWFFVFVFWLSVCMMCVKKKSSVLYNFPTFLYLYIGTENSFSTSIYDYLRVQVLIDSKQSHLRELHLFSLLRGRISIIPFSANQKLPITNFSTITCSIIQTLY